MRFREKTTVTLLIAIFMISMILPCVYADYYQTGGAGTVVGSTESQMGTSSLKLGIPESYVLADLARVLFPVDMTFEELSILSYYYFVDASTPATSGMADCYVKGEAFAEPLNWTPVGYDTYGAPYLVIELDVDDDDVADTWVVQAKFAADTRGSWVQDVIESGEPFHVAGAYAASTGFTIGVDWGSLTEIKAATETIATVEYTLGAADVLQVKIAIGEWNPAGPSAPEGPVVVCLDTVDINCVVYDIESTGVTITTTVIPAEVSISVDPMTVNFGTIIYGHDTAEVKITVTNNGNIDVTVTADIDEAFYQTYLQIGPFAGTLEAYGPWDLGTVDCVGTIFEEYGLQLVAVEDLGIHTGTLVFEATPVPP